MRTPFTRLLVFIGIVLLLGCLMLWFDDLGARIAIVDSAVFVKQSVASPLAANSHNTTSPSGINHDALTFATNVTADFPYPAISTTFTMTCDYDVSRIEKWQRKYELGRRLEYTKRYIKISRRDIQRHILTKLDQKFQAVPAKIVDVRKRYKAGICPEPLTVPVTRSRYPSTANASDFILGVSTTYKRFNDSGATLVNEWAYWLTDSQSHSNGGKLILLLSDASDRELRDAQDTLTRTGIDAEVYRADPTLPMAVRYLALVPKMYNHPDRKGRKWIVTCDDDTFFSSLHALAQRFREFDHEQPLYIGTFSEDALNVQRHGEQAFGGAGVFLSVPLAKTITQRYASCSSADKVHEADTGWGPQGDVLLRKCIYENSATKLTLLDGLWQLDLVGDPSGFYESGVRPLSLHHYRGGMWHVAHPWEYTKVSHVCGEDCLLQRFRTADDFVLATSFSVAHYPKGIDFDLNQTERTFRPVEEGGWNFDYSLGPQRPSLHNTGRKLSWDLQESAVNPDGTVTQVYVRKTSDPRWKEPSGKPMRELDGIIELVWVP